MCVCPGHGEASSESQINPLPVSDGWARAPKRGCPEVFGFKPGSVQGSREGRSLMGHT